MAKTKIVTVQVDLEKFEARLEKALTKVVEQQINAYLDYNIKNEIRNIVQTALDKELMKAAKVNIKQALCK